MKKEKTQEEKAEVKVILIGGNHQNMLGVIRNFGRYGIKSNIIVTDTFKYSFVSKSKYVNDYNVVLPDETEIFNVLKEKYYDLKNKPLMLPTSDFAALFIDRNLDKLKEKFVVPSINGECRAIEKQMNKLEQYKLAQKYGIKMADTKAIKLTEIEIQNIEESDAKDFKIPCILKPIISAKGLKTDIQICKNAKDFIQALKELKQKGYDEILYQEYLKFDIECGVLGCMHNKKVIIPSLFLIYRGYPFDKGTPCYGKCIPNNQSKIDISKLKELLSGINFSGPFDIEIFKIGNEMYLNEINFRNSGIAYMYTVCDIHIAYLYYLMVNGEDISKFKQEIDKEYTIIDEIYEIHLLLNKDISFKEFLDARKQSYKMFIKEKGDNMVVFWKYYYAFKKKVLKLLNKS